MLVSVRNDDLGEKWREKLCEISSKSGHSYFARVEFDLFAGDRVLGLEDLFHRKDVNLKKVCPCNS